MKSDLNFTTYQSPFSWRYGSEKMREIFSEHQRRKTWRKVWVAIAKAQAKEGLISKEELEDIVKNQDNIDISKSHATEAEIKHDLMAEIKTFASQAKIGGGKIHLGATSQDIEDNADIMNFQKAINLVEKNLKQILLSFSKKIDKYQNLVCMAYTHLQPAEPTTLGYRFALYAQDLLIDLELLNFVKLQVKGKGTKGAVGTYASYFALLGEKAISMEEDVMADLKIEAIEVASQVYPRKIDYLILVLLSSIAQSLNKFAFDLRILQSQGFGELMEPFSKNQVGSSAMPFKRNPIQSEKVCSLSRYISSFTKVAWENAANSLLERTLDDSANRRLILPEAFLATDEILNCAKAILENLVVNDINIQKNLEKYGPFAAVEAVLLEAVKKGADRQQLHEILRQQAMAAYDAINKNNTNPLYENIKNDAAILKYLNESNLEKCFDYKKHIGLAPKLAAQISQKVKRVVG